VRGRGGEGRCIIWMESLVLSYKGFAGIDGCMNRLQSQLSYSFECLSE
jgi:hypothetical protein